MKYIKRIMRIKNSQAKVLEGTKAQKAITTAQVKSKGFTLMELIVVFAIFAVITTIALFNQGKLSSNILITNMSYETALAIREAQIYGIGVRESSGDGFAGEYGAYFNLNTPRNIIVYGNGSDSITSGYDQDAPGEAKMQYTFENQRGNQIKFLCKGYLDGSLGETCNSSNSIAELSIVFKRPNPSPQIYTKASVDDEWTLSDSGTRAYIVVNTQDNDACRVIIVEPTGQIRIEDGRNADTALCDNS